MHLAGLVQEPDIWTASVMDIDQRLALAVAEWGQVPSWQARVIRLLGKATAATKAWFIHAPRQTAVDEANRLLADEGTHLACRGIQHTVVKALVHPHMWPIPVR
jgi:hypothetical protein